MLRRLTSSSRVLSTKAPIEFGVSPTTTTTVFDSRRNFMMNHSTTLRSTNYINASTPSSSIHNRRSANSALFEHHPQLEEEVLLSTSPSFPAVPPPPQQQHHHHHPYVTSNSFGGQKAQTTAATATPLHHHQPRNNPVAAYTGNPFPPHATKILAEAANKHNFTSPYWLTSRVVRTKSIGLKEGTPGPTPVCLEGDGTPKEYSAYFVDDIHPDDLSLFLRDVMLPIPENAWVAGTPASFMPSMKNNNKTTRYHPHQQNRHQHGRTMNRMNVSHQPAHQTNNIITNSDNTNNITTMTPIVFVLYRDRWRCPGNTNCAQRLCRWIYQKRRGESSTPSTSSSSSPPFPPVFIHSEYIDGGSNTSNSTSAMMRLLPGAEPMKIEDSTITLFYNADQTTLPPHSVVPIGF